MVNHSFEQVIANICDIELATLLGSYKYTVFGGHTVAIEGHCGLLRYTTTEIAFRLKKGAICIKGEKLVIRNLDKNTAIVSGNNINVEVSQ